MTEKIFATVINNTRGFVEAEIIDADLKEDWAEVRALEGAPFQVNPSCKGGPRLMADRKMVRFSELIFPHRAEEEVPDYGDPAAEDAEADRRQLAEYLDQQDYASQNFHAPGYRGT